MEIDQNNSLNVEITSFENQSESLKIQNEDNLLEISEVENKVRHSSPKIKRRS
jgi:hypothetical protein